MIVNHLAGVDLNLLVALDALLVERNVTRAAARVGLTQPAMSRALGRLRTLLRDELLVRAGRGMVATPRAEQLAQPLSRLLADADSLLRQGLPFDPRTSDRTFRLEANDFIEELVLPGFVAHLGREAPGIQLAVHSASLASDSAAALERGDLDFVISYARASYPGTLRSRVVYRDGFLCLVRRGHPALAGGGLTLERYVALRHLLVAPSGRAGGVVDDLLAELGLARHIAVHVQSFLPVGSIIAASDLVVTMPARLAQRAAERPDLVTVPTPVAVRPFALYLFWHARQDTDLGHRWFREGLVEAGEAASTPQGAAASGA
jgi:DNA-binding transcriptional LysR family regulator